MAIFLPLNVKALSATVSISCKTLNVGKTATCTISGNTKGKVSAVAATLSVSGNASFSSFANGSGWSGGIDGSNIDIYTDTDKMGTFTIGTVTIKGNKAGDAKVSLTNIRVYAGADENYGEFSVSNATKSISVKEPETKATTTKKPTSTTRDINSTTSATTTTTQAIPLEPTSVTVDDFPVTIENGTYYVTVNADTESVNVEATAPEGVVIVGTGKRTLANGKNLVELVLRNEQNVTATFQVVITRPDGGDYDTSLRSLKVVDYNLNFKPDTLEYTVSVPFNTKEVYVIAEALSADVNVNGAGLYTVSNNKTDIYITSSYGDLKTTKYVIHITKNYSLIFMWCAIGGLGISLLGLGIYTITNKKKMAKTTENALTKAKALENRAVKNEDPNQGIAINGQSVVGLGRQAVVPTNIMQNDPQADVRVVANPTATQIIHETPVQTVNQAPDPQVKVVKTVVPTQVKTIVQTHNPAPMPENNNNIN